MATTALVSPTVTIPDPQFLTGVSLTVTTGTAVGTGAQTVTVPWVSGLVVVISSATTAPGLLTLVGPGVGGAASATCTPGAAGIYLFGPIGEQWQAPSTGLVTLTIGTAVATTYAAAYVLSSAGTGAKHNPFENNPQASDF
jgi:hypothetical protein